MSYCNHLGHEGKECPNYVPTPLERDVKRIADAVESIAAERVASIKAAARAEVEELRDQVEFLQSEREHDLDNWNETRDQRDALRADLAAARKDADELRERVAAALAVIARYESIRGPSTAGSEIRAALAGGDSE